MRNFSKFMCLLFFSTIAIAQDDGKKMPEFKQEADVNQCLENLKKLESSIGTETCLEGDNASNSAIQMGEHFLSRNGSKVAISRAIAAQTVMEDATYEKQFMDFSQKDPEFKAAIEYLKGDNNRPAVPLIFSSIDTEPGCGSALGLAYPPPNAKVVMCKRGGNNLSAVVNIFKHEVLHVKQDLEQIKGKDFIFEFNGSSFKSNRALAYTVDPQYKKVMDYVPKFKDKENKDYKELLSQLDELEPFFQISFKEGAINLEQKKPSDVDSDDFQAKLTKYFGKAGSTTRGFSSMLHPRIAKNLGEIPDAAKLKTALAEDMNTLLIAFKNKQSIEEFKNVLLDMDAFYVNQRKVIPSLANFCNEMQASMHSEMNHYIDFLKVRNVQGCNEGHWKSDPEDNIYHSDFLNLNVDGKDVNWLNIEKKIEKHVFTQIVGKVGLYSAGFSTLYGLKEYKEVFTQKNCQKFNPSFAENFKL